LGTSRMKTMIAAIITGIISTNSIALDWPLIVVLELIINTKLNAKFLNLTMVHG
jgi:hypothetical protein